MPSFSALPAETLVVFLHMHKTAGNSLLANLLADGDEERESLPVYARPAGLVVGRDAPRQGWDAAQVARYVAAHAVRDVRIVYGHMVYRGIHELFAPARTPYHATFLRDPVERVISLYQYHRRWGGDWHREIAENDWSLEQWLEHSKMPWRSDGQLRQLLWHSHPEVLEQEELEERHLEAGKEVLARFAFVGTTERFESDSRSLYAELGLRTFDLGIVRRITPDKQPVAEPTRQLIAQRNRLDLELYSFAADALTPGRRAGEARPSLAGQPCA